MRFYLISLQMELIQKNNLLKKKNQFERTFKRL